MSLISNKSFILDEDDDKDLEPYVLPSLVTNKPEVFSIKKSLAGSAFIHFLTPTLIWIISIILLLNCHFTWAHTIRSCGMNIIIRTNMNIVINDINSA